MRQIAGYILAAAVLVFSTSPLAASEMVDTRDSWEGLNRGTHGLNDGLDNVALKPAAQAWVSVAPGPVDRAATNFIQNLKEPNHAINSFLQGKIPQGVGNIARFVINSTVGVFGFFDVAAAGNLPPHEEDFDQTLAVWGVPSGPYFVIPLMGPSTVRGVVGRVLDTAADPVAWIDDDPTRFGLIAFRTVLARRALLGQDDLIQGDRYVLLRDAYLQRRDYLIKDGEIEDTFGDDF